MSFQYTFSKLSKMGEHDEKYGTTYWAEPNEDLTPVKFNSMNQNITLQDTITAEERAERQSNKGTGYYQLKKVKVSGSQGTRDVPASHPVTKGSENPQDAAVVSQLDRIEEKLDKLLGIDEDLS